MTDALQIAGVLLWFWTCVLAFAFALYCGKVSRALREGLDNVAANLREAQRELHEDVAEIRAELEP